MKRIFTFCLLVGAFAATRVSAQQEPQFTNYMFNTLYYNPAYAGTREGVCGNLLFRNQYLTFTGPDKETAPVTQAFNVHSRLNVLPDNQKQWLGIGANLVNDKEGFISTAGVLADIAYHRLLSFGADMSVGTNLGIINKAIDGSKWRAAQPNDPKIPATSSDMGFDAGLGIYIHAPTYYAGLSALHLPQAKVSWKTHSAELVQYATVTTYYFTAGYKYAPLSLPKLAFLGDAIVKRDNARTAMQVSARALYMDHYYGGLNYSAERLNALSALAGLYFDKGSVSTMIGASFDISTSQARYFGPTTEFVVQVCKTITITEVPREWKKGTRTW